MSAFNHKNQISPKGRQRKIDTTSEESNEYRKSSVLRGQTNAGKLYSEISTIQQRISVISKRTSAGIFTRT